jgi:hypothetical protein
MEIEKQRGISVASSVMQFDYRGSVVNLLDTPGHQDFSEDTYRVLTAVDSALMVIDAAKGVEEQTIKLLNVCRMRNTPILTFMNKMDRETREPLATTHFYALNGRILRPLHDHLEACLQRPTGHPLGSPMHVDGAYSLFRMQHPDVVTLMATPSLGGQRSSRSDIFPNKWYDRLPLTRQLAGLARGVKNRAGRSPSRIEGAQHV